MRATCALTALAVCWLGSTTVVHAQRVVGRLGGGTAIASDLGVAGLLALEARFGDVVLRAEGRPTVVTGRMEGGHAGVAIGFAPTAATTAGRPYVLGTLGRSGDIREGDWGTSFGAAAGTDLNRGVLGVFLELRYDHLVQDGFPRHHDLPANQAAFLLGFRIGRPGRSPGT